jgi:antitoxin FitA
VIEEVAAMAMLTVRDLDPEVKDKLRLRAARHGRSMEAEVREILRDVVDSDEPEESLAEAILRVFKDVDPADIPEFDRDRAPARVIEF